MRIRVLNLDHSLLPQHRWLAPWRLLETGKITVISARRRYARGSWQKVSHESLHDLDLNTHQDDRWEQLLAPYREELGRWPLYVSVDKDVMRAADAPVNW